MKTTKQIEIIEIEYWTCANPNHRHRTKDVAQRCIEKALRPARNIKRWSKAELYALLDKKLAGENMSAIAREMGMSSSNLARLTNKAQRIRRREKITGEDYIMPHDRGSKSYL